MTYQDVLLYYFSGTGNSYRVACWMAEAARENGLASQVKAIDSSNPAEEIHAGQLIGLLCPTHAFTAPWAMIRFALSLPHAQGVVDAFVILTRGGSLIGKRVLPGMEGTGAYLLALILALKGYRVHGASGLDMPVTWTVVMPGLSQESAEEIIQQVKPRALDFFQSILAGKTRWHGFIPLAIGLALLPLSVMYLCMGRFFLAKLFYASNRCNGCGLCARSCPVQAVKMRGKTPYWTLSCESCTRCMNFCPQQAVEASYPFGLALMYLSGVSVVALALDWLAQYATVAMGWKGTWVESIITYPYTVLLIVVAYVLFWWAMRLPILNALVTFLTPTRFYRRYHEPGTRITALTLKDKNSHE
jgi:Pyruvate/2-oxoacid:ferredoxin oxidoreductase delta subunit